MKTEAKYDGVLVRSAATSNELILVVEPMDEGGFFLLAGNVTEIRLIEPKMESANMNDLDRSCDEPIWITFSDRVATLRAELNPVQTVPCSNIMATTRDYDAQDLRAKFMRLSGIFKETEESTLKRISELSETKNAVRKFLQSRHHTWSLKRDFFAQKNPAKAKEYEARLEVLTELEKIR